MFLVVPTGCIAELPICQSYKLQNTLISITDATKRPIVNTNLISKFSFVYSCCDGNNIVLHVIREGDGDRQTILPLRVF